ncbi:hypothetical protein Tco_0345425 [Tanacetum coccineum]
MYKLVGYYVGHPLNGKYKPPNQRNNAPKTINIAQTAPSAETTQENQYGTVTPLSGIDMSMNVVMDQLQKQLNQMILLMQQNTNEALE